MSNVPPLFYLLEHGVQGLRNTDYRWRYSAFCLSYDEELPTAKGLTRRDVEGNLSGKIRKLGFKWFYNYINFFSS